MSQNFFSEYTNDFSIKLKHYHLEGKIVLNFSQFFVCRSKSFSFYEWKYMFIFKVIIKHSNSSIFFFANMYYLKEILVWNMFHLYREICSRWIYLEITLFLILKYKLGSLFSIFVMERTFFSFFPFLTILFIEFYKLKFYLPITLQRKIIIFVHMHFFGLKYPFKIVICIYVCICIYICMYKYIYV